MVKWNSGKNNAKNLLKIQMIWKRKICQKHIFTTKEKNKF
jgi:hypothetical protein